MPTRRRVRLVTKVSVMKVPDTILGSKKDVLARLRPNVRALEKGARFEDVDWGSLIEGDEEGACFAIGSPDPADTGGIYHCYAVADLFGTSVARSRLPHARWPELYAWSLEAAWSTAGLFGEEGMVFLLADRDLVWSRALVRAAHRFWPDFAAVGNRFVRGIVCGALWEIPNSVRVAMDRLGAPVEKSTLVSPAFEDAIREWA